MAGNDDLHPLLKSINKTLSRVRQDIQKLTQEVKKIPAILEKGFESMQEAIHENIEAQAELKLMEHMMEVSAVEPQIEAEKEQIQSVERELDNRLNQINERYERKHDELDEKAEKRIRDLGSHIFEIEEDQFQDGVEGPFTTQVTPMWQDLQLHNAKTNQEREAKIRETTETVTEDIDAYIERQKELLTQIEDHLFDPEAVPIETTQPVELQLPYYVVEYQRDGVTNRRVIPPSNVTGTGNPDAWNSVSTVPIEGTTGLIPQDSEINENRATEESLQQTALIEELSQYTESSGFGPTYGDVVSTAIPQQLDVKIEGGNA